MQENQGTLKDFELEVRFKPDANPVFHKAIPVPIAVQEDLESALQAGIKRGIWEPTQFNAYGTPVVPFRKKTSQGQSCLRVCGDYSVTINPQLETRRHQMPQPHAIVTDNAACITSTEFQTWREERGIQHLHGAPYHPQTNGATERLVQTFKQSLKKSNLPRGDALQEFLTPFCRTPLPGGSSPSELLNGRQVHTKLDIIIPVQSPTPARVHKESTPARRSSNGSPCFALSYKEGRRDKWILALVTAFLGFSK